MGVQNSANGCLPLLAVFLVFGLTSTVGERTFGQNIPDSELIAFEDTLLYVQADSAKKLVEHFFLKWYPLFYEDAVLAGRLNPLDIPSPRYCYLFPRLQEIGLSKTWLGDFFTEQFPVPNSEDLAADLKRLESDPCLLYTSPSPRDRTRSRMPSSA